MATKATRPCNARWRPPDAAVVFSGTTVAIGLLALIVLPLPFLRSIGFAGMLIPLVSVVVAVTLAPDRPGDHRLPTRLAAPPPRSAGPAAPGPRGPNCCPRPLGRRRAGAADRWPRCVAAPEPYRPRPTVDTLSRQRQARLAAGSLRARGTPASEPARCSRSRSWLPRPQARAAWAAASHCRVSTVQSHRRARLASGRDRAALDAFPAPLTTRRPGGQHDQPRPDSSSCRARGPRRRHRAPYNADFVSAIYGSFPLMIALIAILHLPLARAGLPLAAAAVEGRDPQS